VIETPRLRLRPHRPDDLTDCLAMWSDPAVVRYIGGKPSSEQQTWSRILTYHGLWELLGFGYWAIEERESGRHAGDAGFADFKRAIAPSMRDVPEAGWALGAEFGGRGYATEALSAALAWVDRAIAPPRIVCLMDAANLASRRVAEKCGFRVFDRVPYGGVDTLLLERRAS